MKEDIEYKINEFIIFCIENYKQKVKLTGKEVYELFEKYELFDYLYNGYDVLHTQGDEWLMKDIDEYLKNKGCCLNKPCIF